MNINEFFPHKVCINLDRRPERWQRAQTEFARHNLDGVVRFAAIDGTSVPVPEGWNHPPGIYGCLQSHVSVVREARRNRLPRVLILEDDVVFHSELAAKFSACVRQLPDDWDMLYLGGLHAFTRPVPVAENVHRLSNSYSTFAYALNHTVYDAFIELNERANEPVDVMNLKLQKSYNCYCFMPHLAWVEESFSDTQNKRLHPWYIKESLVMLSPEWAEIQRNTAVVIAHSAVRGESSAGVRASFLADYYLKHFPSMSVVVVEQATAPTVNPDALPEHCGYKFIKDTGQHNIARCFQLGLEMFQSTRQFFIFTESDLLVESEHLIANLELCLKHDFVSAFAYTIDLSEADTRKIIRGKEVDVAKYISRKRDDICRGACFFTRDGIQKVGGWSAASREPGMQSTKVRSLLSTFDSPNRALRLYSCGRAR